MKINWQHGIKKKIADLKPAKYNPRKMSDYQRKELEKSLTEDGLAMPIVVNTDNTVIGGHQRLITLTKMGVEEVDVSVPDKKLPPEREKKLNLRLNKISGEFDVEKLFSEDFDIETILDAGFEAQDLEGLFDDVTEINPDDFNAQKVAKEIKVPKVQYGQMFQLGEHRLLCGDSTKAEDVAKVVGNNKIDCIYCDPPYNIGLDYASGVTTSGKYKETKKGKTRKDGDGKFPDLAYKGFKVNDAKTLNDYEAFIAQTLNNGIAVSKDNVHVFYWCDQNYIHAIQKQFLVNKITPRRVALWIKNNFNMTPQIAFNKAYEPCVYGTKGSPYLSSIKNLNEILNKEVGSGNKAYDDILSYIDIWLQAREATQSYEHPTQKPVTLHEKPLKRCTAVGHNILDMFGGSGSTLIACEQLKRRAYLLERDPVFVEVIIKRWEQLTGLQAKQIS